MVEIKGGYTPGKAWGSHSGFETGWDPGSGGVGGGGSNVWGLLQKQQQMKDMQARAQLDLIAEQIAASRQQRMTRPERAPETAEQAAIRYMDWAAQMNFGGGPMATYGSKKYYDVMSANDAVTKAAALRGISTGGRHTDLSERGPTEAFQRQSQEAAGRETIASPGPAFEATGMRAGAMPGGSRYGPGFNAGFGNAVPAQAPMGGIEGATFGNSDLDAYSRYGGPNTMGMQPQMPAGYGMKLPPQEEGTLPGTIPETGQALMHEGEAVIPAEQVDQPLLRYLREDAMRKGVPLGQGTRDGYGCGTLKYQAGSLGGPGDMEAYAKWFAEGNDPLQRGAAAQRGIQGWQSTPKPPAPAVPRRSPWLGQLDDVSRRSPWLGKTDDTIKLMAKATEAVEAGKPVADDVTKALKKTKKGKAFLAALVATGGIAAMSGEAEKLPWYKMMMLGSGIGAAPLAVYEATKKMTEQEEPSAPRALGESMRGLVGGAGATVGGVAGPFAQGLAPELEGEQPMPPAPEGPPVEQMMGAQPQPGPPGPQPGSLEGALGRTSQGDFGSPEAPLQLQGAPEGPYPESMQDLRSLPENITARHKAGMNMVEAERLLDHLQFHGHELDPNQYQMLTEQAKQKMALGQMYSKTGQGREQAMKAQALVGAELQKKLLEITTREETKGEQARTTQEQKYDRMERLSTIRQGAMQLRTIVSSALNSDSSRARQENMALLARLMQFAAEGSGDRALSEAEALDIAEGLINAPKEQQEMSIVTLEDILRQIGQ